VDEPRRPGRRKERLVREGGVLDDDAIVVRAFPADRDHALRNLVDDATDSASTYVVVRQDGHREILYGVSVFVSDAFREEEILARFPQAPVFSRMTVRNLRRAGFDLWATGSNPRHYEVQLLPGHLDGEAAVPAGDVRGAAARMLQAVGELLPNPGYAG
jgi:hypothetical protein